MTFLGSGKSHFFSGLNLRQATALALVWAICLPPFSLHASTRKGDKLWNEARVEEGKGNLDKSLQLAEQAYEQDPSDVGYQLEIRRVRFEAGAMHVKNGQKLRNAGKLSEALAEFEKAYGIDPASDIAVQEVKRTRAMIQRNENLSAPPGAAPPPAAEKEEDKTLTPAELARKQQQERTDLLQPVPVLRPLNSGLLDLKMANARPRIMFETWGKLAGINVLFDPEYDTAQTIRAASIDLSRTTLEQGLDTISLVTKSFWKPLNDNTIFVSVDNPTKRRDYTEQVVKVFYLSNVTAPQEMQEMLTVIRTVVDVQKVFSFASQNALVVRADADTMELVEKLVSALDKPRSEVIIDVMVMEVNTTHMRNITAAFANTGIQTSAIFAPRPGITTPGIQTGTTTTGSTTTTTGTTSTTTTPITTPTGTTSGLTGTTGLPTSTNIPLNQLSHISSADFSITNLPGAALEAVLNDSATKVLQAPQIRAVDNVKASLKIGEKVPTASGSFQPGVAGVGVSPLVNTQFTYLDVGVNMEVLPKVHENNEVSLHIDLDISQVDNYQNLGGISEPEIGQNKETADIRLKEGEVNLIGGIIQRTDTRTKTGIPGLANIPLLGRLFSGETLEQDKNELVIALIPHIVRGPDITPSDLRGVMAGTQQQIKVSRGPRVDVPAALAPSPVPAAAVQPAEPGLVAITTTPAIAAPPATAPPVTAPPVTAPPVTAPPVPAPAGAARVSFQPTAAETQLSSTITVTLSGLNITNLQSAAATLRFDPRILRVNNIVAGDLPQRGIAEASRGEVSKNILNDTGQADVSVDRGPGGGISGTGGLFTVTFQAVGRGNTTVSAASVTLKTPAGQAIPVTIPPPLPVNVK